MATSDRGPTVIVVGGGFGGLYAARRLARHGGLADIRGLHLTGHLAWAAWLFVHLLYLIGFENRLLVLVQWAASYLSYAHGARLITGPWHAGGLSSGSRLGD